MINISFQVAGLVNVLVILTVFLVQKKIFFKTTRQLFRIIGLLLLNLGLDIFSLVLIEYYEDTFFTSFICKSYLVTIPLLSYMAFDYIIYDIYKNNVALYRLLYRILTPVGIVLALLTYACPIKIINEPGFGKDVTSGVAIIWIYIWSIACLSVAFALTFVGKKKMTFKRATATRIWILCWVIAAFIQLIWNYVLDMNYDLLLVGFGCSIGVVVLYISLENHGFYINKTLGMFNRQAALDYVGETYYRNERFGVLFVVLDNRFPALNDYDERKALFLRFADDVSMVNKGGYIFYYELNTFIIMRKDIDFGACIETINQKYRELNPLFVNIADPYALQTPIKIFNIAHDIITKTHPDIDTRVIMCNDDYIRRLESRVRNEEKIEKLINSGRTVVVFQPIYSIEEHKFTAAEALVRLQEEDMNIMMPSDFIPYAESSGLIVRLGRDIFKNVCELLSKFDIEQYGMHYIEVNLSIVQLQQENMADDFIQLMNEYNVPANRINFEVTESSYSKNHLVLQNINKLIENGSSISLDDFGTGSSNLEYIISVPADIIKFDKMMVQAYFTDNNTKLVMNDIIKMIKSLNKKIVFEGIEELHQLEEAEKLLVDYIQGFYFSKPLYDDDFMDFIKSQEYNKDLN